MADKTDDLVIGVSTDLSSVQRAIKKLDGDIARAGSQIEKRFAAVGKSIDKALPTGMQDRINKMVGVQVAATKEWTGALANQSKEMDRLRAKFSPMFSTISNYKTAVNEIRAAHRLGAISADEMAIAIQRERQAALSSIAAIKGRNAALADTPAFRGANNFNTANIAAQLQDIGVMAQMGIASPLTIALQQGTQLAAVFNQMGGTRDVIRGIGAAFLSIVNPISLVTIGTIAAGVAAYNYFSESEDGAEATKKALQEQEDLLQRVAQKWGDLLPHIRAAVAEQERLSGRADIETTTQQQIAKVFKDIGTEVSSAGDAIQAVMDLLRNTAPPEQITAMQAALAHLSETAAKNKTSVEDMESAHKTLMDLFRSTNIPVFKETADALAELTPRLSETVDEITKLEGMQASAQAVADLQAEISNISSAKARDELNGLLEKAREGEISVKDLLAELSRISGYAPDVSTIISAFRAVAEAAAAARQASAGIVGKESQGGRVRYNTSGYMQLPDSVDARPTSRPLIEFEAPPKARGGGRTKAPKRTADDRFFEDIEAIKQRTIALAEERAQLGLSYEAQQKRKIAFDLEQKALKDAREAARQKGDQDWQNAQLTPNQIQQIDEVSSAYARQAEELRRAQNEMAFQRDIVQGIMSDVRSALEDGKITTEEWGNIFLGVIDKIVDKLQNDLLDALFEAGSASKGIGGGGGGILSFIPKLFGFASGTANTGGRRGEPRGVVHGQEAVIPLPSGGKVPVQIQAPVAPSYVNRSGPASTETIRVVLQDDSGRMADIADQQIRTRSGALVQLSVQQSVKSVRGQMSGMIAETQARKL